MPNMAIARRTNSSRCGATDRSGACSLLSTRYSAMCRSSSMRSATANNRAQSAGRRCQTASLPTALGSARVKARPRPRTPGGSPAAPNLRAPGAGLPEASSRATRGASPSRAGSAPSASVWEGRAPARAEGGGAGAGGLGGAGRACAAARAASRASLSASDGSRRASISNVSPAHETVTGLREPLLPSGPWPTPKRTPKPTCAARESTSAAAALGVPKMEARVLGGTQARTPR